MKVRITKVPDKNNEPLNAKKWKHADGGILDRLHSVYGDDIEEMKRAVSIALEGKQLLK